jgi:hypothetical protein
MPALQAPAVAGAPVAAAATAVVNGCAVGPLVTPAVGPSPFVFVNPENTPIQLVLSGGTVSLCALLPDGVTLVPTGLLGGVFTLNPGQGLQITYLLAPTLTYWPM